MSRSSRRLILLAVCAAVRLLGTAGAEAADLSLPCGYFNASGGFYRQPAAGYRLRFMAAGGCNVSMMSAPAPLAREEGKWNQPAALSWYAARNPVCMPRQAPRSGRFKHSTAAEEQQAPLREDVGPGVPSSFP